MTALKLRLPHTAARPDAFVCLAMSPRIRSERMSARPVPRSIGAIAC
jgi:hypothetical protein